VKHLKQQRAKSRDGKACEIFIARVRIRVIHIESVNSALEINFVEIELHNSRGIHKKNKRIKRKLKDNGNRNENAIQNRDKSHTTRTNDDI